MYSTINNYNYSICYDYTTTSIPNHTKHITLMIARLLYNLISYSTITQHLFISMQPVPLLLPLF